MTPLQQDQNRRRCALIGRLSTIADLAAETPLEGDLGDVAYDLLRQAAAQISSDRLHIARLLTPEQFAESAKSPGDAGGEGVREARLLMFLEILAAAGGQSDAGDWRGNWINAFCEDHEGRDPDTFNLSLERGLTHSTHDTSFDTSTVWITDAGRAALQPAAPAERGKGL